MKLIWNYTPVLLIVVLFTIFSTTTEKSMSQNVGKNNRNNPILNSIWTSKRDS